MLKKKFHVGDLLSITTGRLVSNRHMEGIYDILNHMTGDNLFTHQLGRASKECKPYLLVWFPELAKADTSKNMARLCELIENAEANHEPPQVGVDIWIKWMSERCQCGFKMEYEVGQIPRDVHEVRDPLTEMIEMKGDKNIIVVESGKEE